MEGSVEVKANGIKKSGEVERACHTESYRLSVQKAPSPAFDPEYLAYGNRYCSGYFPGKMAYTPNAFIYGRQLRHDVHNNRI